MSYINPVYVKTFDEFMDKKYQNYQHVKFQKTVYIDTNHKVFTNPWGIWFEKKVKDSWVWHRLDGPAYICSGSYTLQWFINGFDVTYELGKWSRDNDIDLNNLSNKDISLIKLLWADYEQ